jgi:hypothetical protein
MADSVTTRRGYDTSTVNTRGLLYFWVGFALSLAALLGGVRLWHGPFVSSTARLQSEVPSLPQPLQPSVGHPVLPWEDLEALHQRQEAELHSGGPIPGDPAHVRLPIDAAMDRLLKSGALTQPWKPPATLPWQRPREENTHTVENRT